MTGNRGYSRLVLLLVLAVAAMAVLADHIGSPTFRRNMGEGGIDSVLGQRESQTAACAPCGAPCDPEEEDTEPR